MKTQDFRLGNLCRDKISGKIIKVIGLENAKINSVITFDNSFEGEWQAEPIPLTEEWLLIFGFKSSSLGYFTIFCGSNVMSVYCFQDFSRIQIVSQNVCCIKYVHELQNLYFALTQTELHAN